ncbi:hypothetical protein [Actinocrispum wychmicini]|uniref:hypothetical protein n=1 Tax=Actinocrispum wychmicini TaxID=1213861 RepID=UPI00104321F5|nr:hypothetical protein [Actinocrispum wychmicini]
MSTHHAKPAPHPVLRNITQLAGDAAAAVWRHIFGLGIAATAVMFVVAVVLYLAHHEATLAAVLVLLVGVPVIAGVYAYVTADSFSDPPAQHHVRGDLNEPCPYPHCRRRRAADVAVAPSPAGLALRRRSR